MSSMLLKQKKSSRMSMQDFLKEYSRLKAEYENTMRGLIKHVNDRKIKELKKELGI